MEEKRTFCRICSASCGLIATVDNNKIISVKGDPDHPLSRGYSCLKGRQQAHAIDAPERLRHFLKQSPDKEGSFETISRKVALDEIAEKLTEIKELYGPRSIATYTGVGTQLASVGGFFVQQWTSGLGSPMTHRSDSIDQPSRGVGGEWHGVWGAGQHRFEESDTMMFIGNNPPVSAYAWQGGPQAWNTKGLSHARKRGMKIIVVDPRVTETAKFADIHLQVKPGHDAVLLAAMIRVILDEKLHDQAFCDEHTEGLDALHAAVKQLNIQDAADRAGVPSEQLVTAARTYANGTRGAAFACTGPAMAPNANLMEYFRLCLNTICGRWVREGEKVPGNVLAPDAPPHSQALPVKLIPPYQNPEVNREPNRFGTTRQVLAAMPTGVLPDEILTPGKGQVRALIVMGGNPVASWPDTNKTLRALKSLELLVVVDNVLTETAQLADYALPAAHAFEREDLQAQTAFFGDYPFSEYTHPVTAPPKDVTADWELLYELAQRMGTDIKLPGGTLDLENKPSTKDILNLIYQNTRVSIDELAELEQPTIFNKYADVHSAGRIPGSNARLQLGHREPLRLFRELLESQDQETTNKTKDEFPFLLSSRRMKNVMNSMCQNYPKGDNYNPLFVHSTDMNALAIKDHDLVVVESPDGRIIARAKKDDSMRPRVVSISHGFGRVLNDESDIDHFGSCVQQLISTEHHCDPITGIPRMSAIPVKLGRHHL